MSTSEDVMAAREHFAGRTYQDIARADGDDLPAALRERTNPPQPTTDIAFSRATSGSTPAAMSMYPRSAIITSTTSAVIR
jgi:hypothetical protein